jgi:para-aminobenzoate synthetase/4-amino-4-deoxychorismate lyase
MINRFQMIIRDGFADQWMRFRNPVEILTGYRIEDVPGILREIECAVSREGMHAAGTIGYEAAGAFDPALKTKTDGRFPLIQFALCGEPEILQALPVLDDAGYRTYSWSREFTEEEYALRIDDIRDLIRNGETYQVNLTFRLRGRFEGNPFALFRDLVRSHRAPFAAYIEAGDRILCSASPELFFRLDGRRIVTRPMKGTIARGRTLEEDRGQSRKLAFSEKDRAENLMVVDMMRSDLGKIAETGSVRVTDLFVLEKYPRVWQMTSVIEALTDASFSGILSALFPGASVTGAPKPRTMEIIAGLENSPRGPYTGCIGFFSPGRRAQFNVAIRTAVVDVRESLIEYGVGGGVVWDSTAESEYRECLLKGDIVQKTEPEFELLETLLWTRGEGFFLLDEHLRRLRDSADYFAWVVDPDEVVRRLNALAFEFHNRPQRVRMRVSRDGRISLESIPITGRSETNVLRLRRAKRPVDSSDPFLYHKTTHRRVYDEALKSAGDCDEVVLWNERDQVTETNAANLVVEWGGRLITPPVSSGLLAGTFQRWLLDHGQIEEGVVTFEMLDKTRNLFTINSVRKWRKAVYYP